MGVHNVAHYVVLYVLHYVRDEGRSGLVRAARPPHSSLTYCSRRTDMGGRSKTGRLSAPSFTNGGAKQPGVDRSNDNNDHFLTFLLGYRKSKNCLVDKIIFDSRSIKVGKTLLGSLDRCNPRLQ
jgi:hypothetical protein